MDNSTNKIYIALNNNVFVKEIKQEVKQGSMFIPDNLNNDFTFGEVISVSEGYHDNGHFIPSVVSNGDIIAFPKVCGIKININNTQLIKVAQSDIIAKQVEGTLDI